MSIYTAYSNPAAAMAARLTMRLDDIVGRCRMLKPGQAKQEELCYVPIIGTTFRSSPFPLGRLKESFVILANQTQLFVDNYRTSCSPYTNTIALL